MIQVCHQQINLQLGTKPSSEPLSRNIEGGKKLDFTENHRSTRKCAKRVFSVNLKDQILEEEKKQFSQLETLISPLSTKEGKKNRCRKKFAKSTN